MIWRGTIRPEDARRVLEYVEESGKTLEIIANVSPSLAQLSLVSAEGGVPSAISHEEKRIT